MRQVIFLFFILASLGVRAQDRSYEQMEVDYNRFKSEGKKDSVLLVAREMNDWALKNEGDTSLRYARSFRYMGNGHVNSDSSIYYYNRSKLLLEKENRNCSIDYAYTLYNLAIIYSAMEEWKLSEVHYLSSIEAFNGINITQSPIYYACLKNISQLYGEINQIKKEEVYLIKYLNTLKENNETLQPNYLDALISLGDFYFSNGHIDDAEGYYLSSYKIAKRHTPHAKDELLILRRLLDFYVHVGDITNIKKYQVKYLKAIEVAHSNASIDFAIAVFEIGCFYADKGELIKSEKYLLESLELFKAQYDKGNLYYVVNLFFLGDINESNNNAIQAEYYYKSALNVLIKYHETNYELHADILTGIANAVFSNGNYSEAEKLYLNAYEIADIHCSDDSEVLKSCLNNLGIYYASIGKYDNAILYYLKLNALLVASKDVLDTLFNINMLHNLGLAYMEIGSYIKAENNLCEASRLARNYVDNLDLGFADLINNLGRLYFETGEYSKADSLFAKSLEIKLLLLPKNHMDIAKSYNNMAVVHRAMNNFKMADLYYLKALDVLRENYGKHCKDCSFVLGNIGNLCVDMREYSRAEKYLTECVSLCNEYYGNNSRYYIKSLQNLFICYFESGQYNLLNTVFAQYLESVKETIGRSNVLSDENIFNFKNECNYVLNLYINHWALSKQSNFELIQPVFNNWLIFNGWSFGRDALFEKVVSAAEDSIITGIYNELIFAQRQINDYQFLSKMELYSRGIDLDAEINRIEMLRATLNQHIKGLERIDNIYDMESIAERLGEDELYMDVFKVPFYDFTNKHMADSSFYVSLVLDPISKLEPKLIYLGDGKQIDEILYPYLVNQTANPESAIMDGLVYDVLWKPLEEHLVGKTKIYLSPGGIYHSINPETIYHAETGKYLFEEKEIHLVNSGRSFVDQRIYDNRDYTDRTALIMGAPNFDYSYVVDSTLLVDNVSFTYQTMRDLSLDGNRRITPLPATRSEIEGINQTLVSTAWNTQLLTGNDALEMNLKQMDSPRILHIATHGYFLEDIKPENDNGMRMMGMDAQRVAENPMLRSGLLLAGCNKTLADNTPLTGGDNGILTAYEAGLLDLSNTELVVLSACETGKGEILNGEGVQGLRKAMTDAGAEHILMSLWKVDDKVTSEYMQTFYGHYAQGKSIRESYNLTRNEIKQKYPQPFYWGAFVLVGE
jgi:CHAT domain-containing protein